jgi:hypothetical protein
MPTPGSRPGQPTPPAAAARPDGVFAVRLIDRRTGMPLRMDGRPLVIFTRTPGETAMEALAGRDPALWDLRIERLATTGAAVR